MKNRLIQSALISLLSLSFVSCVTANEITDSQVKWIAKYKKQKTVPKPEAMLLNEDPEPDLSEGFVDLYNGKNLEGWKARGGAAIFTAHEGYIEGVCKGPSTYLSTLKEDYTDFIVTVEINTVVDGNTGMIFRGDKRQGKKGEEVFGPQVEMEERSKGRYWSGGLYWQGCGGWIYPLWLEAHEEVRAARKAEGWNRLTVKAVGDSIKTWFNGVPAAHVVSEDYLKGFISLQVHAGKQGTIQFRNIKIKELK